MSEDVVFITGSSRGIGRALARAAPHGARVIGVSRTPTEGHEHLQADLATAEGWAAVSEALHREFEDFSGGRAVLIHAAGTLAPIGFAGEVDAAAYRDNVLVNSAAGQVIGHHFLAATRHLDVRRELVMVSSGAASSAYEGWSAYCAGKAALDHWVRTVGAEQRRRGGATVVAIAPGVVATAMQEHIREQDPTDFPRVERFHHLHREGQLRDPEAVARELWQLLDDRPMSGSVLDLRDR